MTHPDIVYVVRPGDRNEELRYSLRSLANLPHGRVWIAGFMPRWVTGAEHIPAPTHSVPHVQTKANLRAACEHPEVSESFIYFNDDFFVMQPLDELPVMHRGPLPDAVRSGIMATAYTKAMRLTMSILEKRGIAEPLMYDLHAPMLVTKTGMLEALDLCAKSTTQERTLFGNLQQVGGEKAHNHKVRRQDRGWSSWPFISTNDVTFRTLPVGEYIRRRFDTPSPYETDPPARATRTTRTPTPMRRPVRYRSVGNRVREVA